MSSHTLLFYLYLFSHILDFKTLNLKIMLLHFLIFSLILNIENSISYEH